MLCLVWRTKRGWFSKCPRGFFPSYLPPPLPSHPNSHMLQKLYSLVKGDIQGDSPDSPINQEVLQGGHVFLILLKVSIMGAFVSAPPMICHGASLRISFLPYTPCRRDYKTTLVCSAL